MFGIKKRRRERLKAQPFPPSWLEVIERDVPYYACLPPDDRAELLGHTQVLLAEKNYEGCGGLTLTDDIKVIIAAHASVLLLHRDTDYYPCLVSILVYPAAFVVEAKTRGPGGYMLEHQETHAGEAWQRGVVILAWDGMLQSVHDAHDGFNVAFHEFAHQLDMENGQADGFPCLNDPALAKVWPKVLGDAYTQLCRHIEQGRPTLLGDYAATSPAEFFAVATECFFEIPGKMRKQHPALYAVLGSFYRQDPGALDAGGG